MQEIEDHVSLAGKMENDGLSVIFHKSKNKVQEGC